MPRPIWKGHISFGLVNIPVILHAAEKPSELSFHLIDKKNHSRIRYERINEATGKPVAWENTVKGYEYEDNEYVLLSDEDFKRAAAEATQTIAIEDFVELETIDTIYFDKPYILVPVKKTEKGYVLLREILQRTAKAAIAKIVMHTREHLAAVYAKDEALMLTLLRFKEELVSPDTYELPAGGPQKYKISKRELEIAEQLVKAMTGPWRPDQYQDEYRHALMKWIQKKVKSGQLDEIHDTKPAKSERKGGQVIDIADLLKQSVERTATSGKIRRKKRA